MSGKTGTRAAIYTRVSTEEQSRRLGLKAQLTECRAFCMTRHIQIVDVYQDAVTGTTNARPDLQRLKEDAAKGRFNLVVVAKLDRLARKLLLQLLTIDELEKMGVAVVSVAEPDTDDRATSALLRNVLGSFSEFERMRIGDRLARCRCEKARLGGHAGGRAPYGYRPNEDHRLVQVPEQARVVRQIFALRAERYTMSEIARLLAGQGVKTSEGKDFRRQTVARILRSRDFYKGSYRYGDIESKGDYPAIL